MTVKTNEEYTARCKALIAELKKKPRALLAARLALELIDAEIRDDFKAKYGPLIDAHEKRRLELDEQLLGMHEKIGRLKFLIKHQPTLELGRRFQRGRKPRTGSAIRKAIAKALEVDPDIDNTALWKQLAKDPPRGWQCFDNAHGKYIEGPSARDGSMSYRRFCNIAAEERGKVRR